MSLMIVVIFGYVFLLSLALSLILVPIAKKLAIHWNIHDHPGERKIHQTPKPYLGGVAIFLSFFITIVFNLIIYLLLLG